MQKLSVEKRHYRMLCRSPQIRAGGISEKNRLKSEISIFLFLKCTDIPYYFTLLRTLFKSHYSKAVPQRHSGVRRRGGITPTHALDACVWSASRPGRALTQGKGPPIPIVQEAGWAPDTQTRGRIFASAGDRTPIVQSVVRHYTD
jgi:hypothetical protein